jgi:hypothetical protein
LPSECHSFDLAKRGRDTKTEVSSKPVPLPPYVVEELKQWREASLYKSRTTFTPPPSGRMAHRPSRRTAFEAGDSTGIEKEWRD